MKHIHSVLNSLKHCLLVLPFALCLVTIPAQAATLDDVVKSVDKVPEKIGDLLEAFKAMYLNYIFEVDPSAPPSMAGHAALTASSEAIQTKLEELSAPDVKEALIRKNADHDQRILAGIIASDSTQQQNAAVSTAGAGTKEEKDKEKGKGKGKKKEGDANFNSQTLVLPLVYDSEEAQAAARRYIQFVMSGVDPLTTVPIADLTNAQKEQLDNTPVGRDYKIRLRSMVAQRSVALNNLLQLYVDRMPVPNLGKDAGLPGENPDASPAQVQEYLATRRTKNASWYEEMSTAAPATVAREQLFLTAEIQRQIYQLHKDNQQMLLILSMIALQNLQMNKIIDHSKEDAARKLLGI